MAIVRHLFDAGQRQNFDRRLLLFGRGLRHGGPGVCVRQIQREGAALARSADQADFTAEQVRQFAADRKAQARAAEFAAGAGVRLLERFKNDPLLLGRDADAGVADLKGNDVRRAAQHRMIGGPPALRAKD